MFLSYLITAVYLFQDGDENQDTPLLIAVRKGSEDAVDLLLKHGALPNLANVVSISFIVVVSVCLIRILLLHMLLLLQEGDTPLIEAVKAKRASIVNLLLSHGAVPDLANAVR